MAVYIYIYIYIFILCTTIIGVSCQCDNGFIRHDDSCYHISHDKEAWASAEEICKVFHGAHLAEITEAKENTFLFNEVKALKTSFWIGGSDLLVEGEWKWLTSVLPVSYNAWYPNEPSNSADNENCMIFMPNGQWNDGQCYSPLRYICEKPVENGEIVG